MPTELHSLYKKLLDKAVEKEVRNQAALGQKGSASGIKTILSFVAVSKRPLSLLELSEACKLHLEEDDVQTRVRFVREEIEACRLMVVIQDENVLLLHKSIREFLVGDGPRHFINELEAHANVAYRCVDIFIKQSSTKRGFQHTKLWQYAYRHWADHIRMAESRFDFEVSDRHAKIFKIKFRNGWRTQS